MALAIKSDQTNNFSAFQANQSLWLSAKPLALEAYPGELAELRQQSNQLHHIVDVLPAGVIVLDGNGIVIKVNKIASRLLEEPILGEAWFNVIQNSFQPRADDWHEVSLKDGRRVKLDIMALEHMSGQLILITDLTETRLLQDKISQMQRLSSLGKMVSTLAHQIRTPLSSAILYGANLANQSLGDSARINFQQKLMNRLHDLEQQVNDMLLFAKSGNQQVVELLGVNDVIQDAIASLEPQLKHHQVQIKLNLCEENCQIMGNRSALIGAIQNLVNNSIDIIKNNIEVSIASYCAQNSVYISVLDNGPGIAAEVIDKIFDPFFTARAQGTGLGLAVVKAVAQAHQGAVSVLSKPNESAHFCIELPSFSKTKRDETVMIGGQHEFK